MNTTDLPTCIDAKLNRYFDQLKDEQVCGILKMVVQESELITIKFVLNKTNYNQSKAAKILGINRWTLKQKIVLYQL